uniref:Cyclin N-terminal domain containing 1 n=1 Tax=Stegastes partitus TaxID=144197 RepID=A0A3B5AQN0_9TELE
MAKTLIRSLEQSDVVSLKFRQASSQLLTDFLINFNKRNKDNLNSLSKYSGSFKRKRLIGATAEQPRSYEDAIFDKLKDKFPLIVFSCVQLASKLSLYSRMIDNNAAVRFLHSVGHSVSKQAVLESELMVLKGLEFKLNVPNPLTFVEMLLEVLGHNEPSIPVDRLYHLSTRYCFHYTHSHFIHLEALIISALIWHSSSLKTREKFVTVTEDCMLLGVGVIAVAFSLNALQVVGELTHITGISRRCISDFAHVTLVHIVGTSFPQL